MIGNALEMATELVVLLLDREKRFWELLDLVTR